MFWSRCTFMDNIMFSPLLFLERIPYFSVCLWGTAMHWFISWHTEHWLSISLRKQQQSPAEQLPRITYHCMASDEKKLKRVKRIPVGVYVLFAHIEPLLADCFSMFLLFFWPHPTTPIYINLHVTPIMPRCDFTHFHYIPFKNGLILPWVFEKTYKKEHNLIP